MDILKQYILKQYIQISLQLIPVAWKLCLMDNKCWEKNAY